MTPLLVQEPAVEHLPDESVSLRFYVGDQCVSGLGIDYDGFINDVWTHPDYRRQGLATALYRFAEASTELPTPIHSPCLSADGRKWATAVGGMHWDEHRMQRDGN